MASGDFARIRGSYYVVPTASSIREARRLFKDRRGPYFELRSQSLKLAYFPSGEVTGPTGESTGEVIDMDWSWIIGAGKIRDLPIGELRIHDVIGDFDNLRVIFLPVPRRLEGDPLPRIWILSVLQKKTQRFTTAMLDVFRSRARIVLQRNYPV